MSRKEVTWDEICKNEPIHEYLLALHVQDHLKVTNDT
jgi:hypothetical protein